MMKLNRLVELRKKHNLTQGEVADLLDVARTTYAGWEQGHRDIDINSLLLLRSKYKVSLDYIFEITDNPISYLDLSNEEIEFLTRSLEIYRSIKNKY